MKAILNKLLSMMIDEQKSFLTFQCVTFFVRHSENTNI